jgi:hypothetical protein
MLIRMCIIRQGEKGVVGCMSFWVSDINFRVLHENDMCQEFLISSIA